MPAASPPGALLLPALAAGVLALVLGGEVLGGGGARRVSLPPGRAEAMAVATAPSVVRTPADLAATAATILARPLFSSDRRPARTASATGPAASAPRLSAIMIGGAQRACVFDNGGHPLLAREGGHAGPYTIVRIAADRVTVATADGQRVLRPTALPAGSAATPTGTAALPGTPATDPAATPLQNLLSRLRGMRRSE